MVKEGYSPLFETKRAKGRVLYIGSSLLLCLQVYAWFGFIGRVTYQNQEKMEGLAGWVCWVLSYGSGFIGSSPNPAGGILPLGKLSRIDYLKGIYIT